MSTLPPFTFDSVIDANTAKQDRIHVMLHGWGLHGSAEGVEALKSRMGKPPPALLASAQETGRTTLLSHWGNLFNRPQRQGGVYKDLLIRRNPFGVGTTQRHPPLFSGLWRTPGHRPGRSAHTPIASYLDLQLNPTRYVRYQSPNPFPDPTGEHWPQSRLFAAKVTVFRDEQALDQKDNWIPDTMRFGAFSNPGRWQRHLMTYLRAVRSLFESELERASQHSGTADWTRISDRYNLREVETYWEFSSDNPTALVKSLTPLFTSFATETNATCYNSGIDHNAVTLYADVNPGRSIKIYAKTNRRIRIEVTHRFGTKGYRTLGSHTGANWQSIPNHLESCAQDATDLVTRMLTRFRSIRNLPTVHVPPYQLLLEIASYSRKLTVATTIASLLVHNERIAAAGNSPAIQRALHRLREAGVLIYEPESGVYTVAPSRRISLKHLQQHGDYSILTVRQRRRVTE